jgi:hypothetical protein
MADLGDVANALVTLAANAVYPNGVSAGSPLGINLRVYRGHPTADVLDADLRQGYTQEGGVLVLTNPTARIAHICINPRPGVGRPAKPYVFAPPQNAAIPPTTITAVAAGTTVTLGGTISAGQGAAIGVNGEFFGYTATGTDTLANMAAALATLINVATPATAAGSVITIPAAYALFANTFVQVEVSQETERQIQGFVLTIYAPGRDMRDLVGKTIATAFSQQIRFTLDDGFQAYMLQGPPIAVDDDKPEKEILFVRMMYYTVEFPTVVESEAATLAIAAGQVTNQFGGNVATIVEA